MQIQKSCTKCGSRWIRYDHTEMEDVCLNCGKRSGFDPSKLEDYLFELKTMNTMSQVPMPS